MLENSGGNEKQEENESSEFGVEIAEQGINFLSIMDDYSDTSSSSKSNDSSSKFSEMPASKSHARDRDIERSAEALLRCISEDGTFSDEASQKNFEAVIGGAFLHGSEYLEKVIASANEQLEASGAGFEFKLDGVSRSSGPDYPESGEPWSGHKQDLQLSIQEREGSGDGQGQVIDTLTMTGLENRKDVPNEGEINTIVERISELGAAALQDPEIINLFKTANERYLWNSAEEIVRMVNEQLAEKSPDLPQLTCSSTSEITSESRWGQSGSGLNTATIGMKMPDGQTVDGFDLKTHFLWGAPKLPSPPDRPSFPRPEQPFLGDRLRVSGNSLPRLEIGS